MIILYIWLLISIFDYKFYICVYLIIDYVYVYLIILCIWSFILIISCIWLFDHSNNFVK